MEPKKTKNENNRLKALQSYEILDTLSDKEYDEITFLASQISGKKIAGISLVDANRQWFKSAHNIDTPETHRSISFCGHAINTPSNPFIIQDALKDKRFSTNPLVIGKPNIRFYGGFPLNDEDGYCLGTLCVIDDIAGELDDGQLNALKILSNNVITLLTLRRRNLELNGNFKKIELSLNKNKLIADFVEENPNPVLRVDYDHNLTYCNESSRKSFLDDFKIIRFKIRDKELKSDIDEFIGSKAKQKTIDKNINNSHYILNLVNIPEKGCINIYVNDVTSSFKKSDEIKGFFETILDYFPVDIAVFNSDQEYLFVNQTGVKDTATRKFLTGKTDFDYFKMKNLPNDLAHMRREKFIRAKSNLNEVTWEEETNKKGEFKTIRRQYSPIINNSGESLYYVGYGVDISELKLTQKKLTKQLDLSQLLSEIAQSFIGLNSDLFNELIGQNLQKIAEHLNAKRAYFYIYDFDNEFIRLVQEYCESQFILNERYKNVHLSLIPDWRIHKHKNGESVIIEDIDDLKDINYKQELKHLNIQSIFSIPCMVQNRCIGFIGVDFDETQRNPSSAELTLLTIFSQIVGSSYTSMLDLSEIKNQNLKIARFNDTLEERVALKTSEIQRLSEQLSSLDKSAMIGELTANIAHDLNTPLGSINAAIESVENIIQSLFSKTLISCTQKQIELVNNRDISNINATIGMVQRLKEVKQWKKVFENEFECKEPDKTQIIELIVINRFRITEKDLIKRILNFPNRIEVLKLYHETLMLKVLNEIIGFSSQRATEVIKNLRLYIKEGNPSVEKKTEINLEESIRSVLRIFEYYMRRGVTLHWEKTENVSIVTYSSKLYQIWSNIIKNAMDAMNGSGNIFISISQGTNGKLISIANDGAKIPDDILPNIFNKFFTTKDDERGTGLGLNIVKTIVVDELEGNISVKSTNNKTTFLIQFN